MRSPQTLAKLIVLLACISSVQHAIALDLEIVIGVKERQAATKPFCLSLARQKTPTSIEDQYRKGLCELYGIAGKTHRHLGLRWLRIAAKADYTEAEIALADYLQTQSDDQQSEALQWYAVAQAAHDARAIGRYELLAPTEN